MIKILKETLRITSLIIGFFIIETGIGISFLLIIKSMLSI